MTTVGYSYDPLFLEHTRPGHPESAERLRSVMALLEKGGDLPQLKQLSMQPATFDELSAVHDPAYVSALHQLSAGGGGHFGPDTYVMPRSFDAAALAAGAAMRCATAVMAGEVKRAFALVRPPGHHAFANRGEGFCLFNNMAFAAQAALGRAHSGAAESGDAMWSQSARRSHAASQPRAMIVDFDVHHGNGTQAIFEGDPSVLVLSMHQFGNIYPGSGHHSEVGEGAGRGGTINVPLTAWAGDAAYARVFDEIVLPAARRFKPSVLLVSAGFDAHWRDPLAAMMVTLTGFARMATVLCDLADELCDGRLVAVLEGGYDLEALAHGTRNMLRVMRGAPGCVEDPIGPAKQQERAVDGVIAAVKKTHGLA